MVDPGTIIAAVTIAYTGAIKAWSTFQTALNYDDDSANLVVRLEIEKFRLQTWALNVGLTKGTFDASLHPIHELIAERLKRITKLFDEAEGVRNSFGLVVSDAAKIQPEKVHSIVSGMASSIRYMGIKLDIEVKPKELDGKNISNKIRWALSSKSKFVKLISSIEDCIDKLDALLTESQRRSAKDDWKQITIVVAGNVPMEQIEIIQQALRPGITDNTSKSIAGIGALVERKAINSSTLTPRPGGARSLQKRDLEEFVLPTDLAAKTRVLAAPKELARAALGPGPFLLERKRYDPNISAPDKRVLKTRLDRLILLLSSARSDDFRAFRAVGYCDEPSSFSWWLVFQFPSSDGSRMVSLRNVFSLKEKPSLENRFSLASLFSKTVAELFNSGWMHKCIRSDNVLFPEVRAAKTAVPEMPKISSPYLAGFEYSRQDTEAVTIDKGKHLHEIESAIYRHPDYQGEAASGYRMKYDIYSFGLVLAEIALWTPLLKFLDPKGAIAADGVQLSSKMKSFHREEAVELKNRVLGRVDGELGFRVGSKFQHVVRWCLTMSEEEDEEEWHPALGFHNHVVAPLERCAALSDE
ncbi:prion-inhibition and propagation-domain-containing protein [Leptodontidium sp. 2 PMI_412]|nr:prion-inhibition and propagation-domain-containing protein [Leptodontidium sp. MPI-SDFR-AT-0119]KAH9216851.1 prion-inhibition and propagation-domain-containing protein [Leptodontidium sp. 2 PMI_412]